jgi:CheY-like chemotaxis protein
LKHFIEVHFPEEGMTFELALPVLASRAHAKLRATQPQRTDADIRQQIEAAFADHTAMVALLRSLLTWSDLRSAARLIDYELRMPTDINSCQWSDVYDEPRAVDLPDGEIGGYLPLDLHLSAMWLVGARVCAQLYSDTNGAAMGAMIFVTGNQEQIDKYLALNAQLSNQINEASPPTH